MVVEKPWEHLECVHVCVHEPRQRSEVVTALKD